MEHLAVSSRARQGGALANTERLSSRPASVSLLTIYSWRACLPPLSRLFRPTFRLAQPLYHHHHPLRRRHRRRSLAASVSRSRFLLHDPRRSLRCLRRTTSPTRRAIRAVLPGPVRRIARLARYRPTAARRAAATGSDQRSWRRYDRSGAPAIWAGRQSHALSPSESRKALGHS